MGGMKEWVQRCQPVQLYLILGLTVLVFLLELVVSHITHALTLLMDSYHMLCNIIALVGCIATIKYGNKKEDEKEQVPIVSDVAEEVKTKVKEYVVSTREKSLKNTFGWARLDVIFMLICCVFLASLSFSLVVEALQTLVHINHQDEMHYPIPVMCVGALGILLNGICYVLIGGYTFHQGSFLYVTKEGDVVLNKVVTNDSVKQGERRLSRTQSLRIIPRVNYQERQGFREMCRDIIGCVIVVITSIIVYLTDKDVAKFIDPSFSILSAVILMYLSFPYMKESCLILLQTIPNSINIDILRTQLLKAFPDIINVHDLHVWQLTAHKVISTAHIIFQNPTEYAKISEGIKEFFLDHGITQVTIQPEFKIKNNKLNPNYSQGVCLMKCLSEGCQQSSCCNDIFLLKESIQSIPEIKITPCEEQNGELEQVSVIKTIQPIEIVDKKKLNQKPAETKTVDEEEQPINRCTNDEDTDDNDEPSSDLPNNDTSLEESKIIDDDKKSMTENQDDKEMCSNTNNDNNKS